MTEQLKYSHEGVQAWFSPEHAGEKFRQLALELAEIGGKADSNAKTRAFAESVWQAHETAMAYARHYLQDCPVKSVRIMQPTGAIFVMLADGREVLVPQPNK